MEKVKKDDIPEQAVLDPVTGRDLTSDHAKNSLKNMGENLERVFEEARDRRDDGEDTEKLFEELKQKIEDIISAAYFSMKEPTPPELVVKNEKILAEVLGVEG